MKQIKITNQLTHGDTLSQDEFLNKIGKITSLIPGEEETMARNIRKGDKRAFEILVNANLRFVVPIAQQYQNQGLSLQELINEGNLGLIKTVELFNETKGFKFTAYAVWWIRQAILQAIAEQSRIIALQSNKTGSVSKLNKAFYQLEQDFQREPTVEEIASIRDIHQIFVEVA